MLLGNKAFLVAVGAFTYDFPTRKSGVIKHIYTDGWKQILSPLTAFGDLARSSQSYSCATRPWCPNPGRGIYPQQGWRTHP